jgi:hypothetical protein
MSMQLQKGQQYVMVTVYSVFVDGKEDSKFSLVVFSILEGKGKVRLQSGLLH